MFANGRDFYKESIQTAGQIWAYLDRSDVECLGTRKIL